MAKRKGEAITLYCSHCTWSTELSMEQASDSVVVECSHCGEPIHWYRCEHCDLCYAGTAEPKCPICEDESLDDLTLD